MIVDLGTRSGSDRATNLYLLRSPERAASGSVAVTLADLNGCTGSDFVTGRQLSASSMSQTGTRG